MKVAIQNQYGWNKKWLKYVKENNIPYILVDCYSNNIFEVLKDNSVTHLMWHFNHNNAKDIFMARKVLFSAQVSGIKVFPDINTSWHFDDKISQKYLLEAIDAPLIPSYVFYDKKDALCWAKETTYPKVAKLRRGAGSYNVKLIKNRLEANIYIEKMFKSGVKPSPGYIADFRTKIKVAGDLNGIIQRIKKAPKFIKMVYLGKQGFPKEKNYAYFQDFIPNNNCDYRLMVVNSKTIGMKRMVREGDFRASGAGIFDFSDIEENIIKESQEIAKKLNMLSVAFDFLLSDGKPVIAEISYGFGTQGFDMIKSYRDDNNRVIQGSFDVPNEIIKGFLNK